MNFQHRREQPLDSPHARGWTRPRPGRDRRRGGFPARAGMDPACSTCCGASARIPRTRGDGPGGGIAPALGRADSPHARGWTPRRGGPRSRDVGFPARAGMDPATIAPRRRRPRIPRTRGDGPGRVGGPRAATGDSPHARGWTPNTRTHKEATPGFPARAGMDPRRSTSHPSGRWIPRTRGDGPSTNWHDDTKPPDSPHARGWTVPGHAGRQAQVGFPARAGMDPRPTSTPGTRGGIPRTRGDGPRPERW